MATFSFYFLSFAWPLALGIFFGLLSNKVNRGSFWWIVPLPTLGILVCLSLYTSVWYGVAFAVMSLSGLLTGVIFKNRNLGKFQVGFVWGFLPLIGQLIAITLLLISGDRTTHSSGGNIQHAHGSHD
ncbi:hypothetical protein A3K29_05055 [Candidatus Collierbacteria bacterium RIFOXYB2_FULL_46_14]|uniref:DUF805 domain-containing protein n=1 Tax=Candidatus Collierbacteria bacterium GW2011_GWA2_46_26 TaxID=1618381 RepID=A0A0G1PJQ6_9BACT|nr:MAG: hypothetical protein UX47_C0006G0025 [Candidatus Collierbacteria bacterium GW2011_GWA2_46_26]OGD73465.1 MAG: hypothetical protein A3K29_05055 [Candidatus Collierbacteria bacterium RIFOXYB2_FULL_46_14]OGD76507.1 MAG: hypothetical protein A3K43_05055 [Candidatus Collierbacteria bacterium RIFOXYA2_FULL_46_20]OGD77843.1 MAG: hypothetical protein A3K39_05055 [Candidatus Collierbacteria bacterium RIFOXYC2_FULL_43_15]OGD81134.1 MAG: hypothetical protein A2320_05555 [Pseudomonadales bacterium G